MTIYAVMGETREINKLLCGTVATGLSTQFKVETHECSGNENFHRHLCRDELAAHARSMRLLASEEMVVCHTVPASHVKRSFLHDLEISAPQEQ